MLHDVVSKTEPLLEKDKQDDLLAKACGGLYLFKNGRVLVLTFELICIFAANNAFVTAAAIELQRNGFSSAWIGMITMPSGLMQCLLSQWAGRVLVRSKTRANSSVYTNIARVFTVVYSFHRQEHGIFGHPGFICQQHVAGAYSLHVGRFVRGTGRCRCPGDVDDGRLAAAQGVGYGQALTASEMAINAGRFQSPDTSGNRWIYEWKPSAWVLDVLVILMVYDIFILNVRFCSIFGHKWEFISVYINPFLF